MGAVIAGAILASALLGSAPAGAQLTRFCQFTGNPGRCGPYDHYGDAIGQDLHVTLVLNARGTQPPPVPAGPDGKLNTIRDVFAALRACFTGAALDEPPRDRSATLRFSFTRWGTLIGAPRFTYVEPALPAEAAATFERAIGRTLVACSPFPFSNGLGGALAGRPLSVRIIQPGKTPLRS